MSLKFCYEPKTTCFGYNHEKKECRALSELVCANKEKCSFYKNRADVDFVEIERAVRNYKV